MQVTREATPSARPRSCSTSTTVVPPRDERLERVVDRGDGHRRQPERHLVEQDEPRVAHERAADCGRLLLATRQRRGALLAPLAQHREDVSSTRSTVQAPPRRCPRRRSGSPRRRGPERAGVPRGPARCPRLTRRCAGTLVMSTPSKTMLPATGRCAPAMVRSNVVFPAPLAPTSARVSPSSMRERHAANRLEQPVLRIDRAHLEQAHGTAAPRYASMTRVSASTSVGQTVGDDPSGVEAHETIDRLHEDVHDVLDPDDGDAAPAQLLDGAHQLDRLRVGEAAADLVEKQHLRIGGERARELETLAIEQAEIRRRGGWRHRRARTSRSTSTARCVGIGAARCPRRASRRRARSRRPSCRRTDAGSDASARCRGGSDGRRARR